MRLAILDCSLASLRRCPAGPLQRLVRRQSDSFWCPLRSEFRSRDIDQAGWGGARIRLEIPANNIETECITRPTWDGSTSEEPFRMIVSVDVHCRSRTLTDTRNVFRRQSRGPRRCGATENLKRELIGKALRNHRFEEGGPIAGGSPSNGVMQLVSDDPRQSTGNEVRHITRGGVQPDQNAPRVRSIAPHTVSRNGTSGVESYIDRHVTEPKNG